MIDKVKLKKESESSSDTLNRVVVKKAEPTRLIPAHLAAILALKPQETTLEAPVAHTSAVVFPKQKDRLEPDPNRSLVAVTWDKKDRLVLEFDDGEHLLSPPAPSGTITKTSVVVSAGQGSNGNGSEAVVSFETVSKNLDATDAVYSYSVDGDLQSVLYSSGVAKTLGYSSGLLQTVSLSGSTPGGIELTKTLSYSAGNLTAVTYS